MQGERYGMAMKATARALAAAPQNRIRQMRVFWFTSLAAAIVAIGVSLMAGPAKARGPVSVAPLAEDLSDAVVNISTSQSVKGADGKPLPRVPDGSPFEELFEDFFKKRKGPSSGRRKVASLGSGFVIDGKEGLVVTNNHVIDGADEITVIFRDGSKLKVEKVLGTDGKTDLALLKVKPQKPLKSVKFGSSEQLRVGDWVLAIGNPFGLGGSVSVGIISAKQRDIQSGPYDDYLQTDAAINKGNSGGPLFNMKGEVIGINTAIIAGGQGIGFAIPVNMAKQIIPQLRDDGHVTRGWLGVTVQAMSKELADSFGLDNTHGALVNEVVKDSPAADAGLKRGDVILTFDGQMIKELNDLPQLVAATAVDKTVKVEIFRDGKKREVKVKIGKLDEGNGGFVAEEKQEEGALGITAADVTPELAARYSLEGQEGVLVTRIDPDGPAAEANLRVGDLILEADGQEVDSVKSFKTVIDGLREGKVLRLLIQRKSTLLYTTVKLN